MSSLDAAGFILPIFKEPQSERNEGELQILNGCGWLGNATLETCMNIT